MTIQEAKDKISKEFILLYNEWMYDTRFMDDDRYALKYKQGKPENTYNYNQKSVYVFLRNIFSGRYLPQWENLGFSRVVIWNLVKEGWLCEKTSWSARAIREGKTKWYYIPQRTAKEIYNNRYNLEEYV